MAKVYVAGSSQDLGRVAEVSTALVKAGHSTTMDWFKYCLAAEAGEPVPTNPQICKEIIAAIRSADILVVLEHPALRDARWEFGYAEALGKPVVTVKSEECWCIFLERSAIKREADIAGLVAALAEIERVELIKSGLMGG